MTNPIPFLRATYGKNLIAGSPGCFPFSCPDELVTRTPRFRSSSPLPVLIRTLEANAAVTLPALCSPAAAAAAAAATIPSQRSASARRRDDRNGAASTDERRADSTSARPSASPRRRDDRNGAASTDERRAAATSPEKDEKDAEIANLRTLLADEQSKNEKFVERMNALSTEHEKAHNAKGTRNTWKAFYDKHDVLHRAASEVVRSTVQPLIKFYPDIGWRLHDPRPSSMSSIIKLKIAPAIDEENESREKRGQPLIDWPSAWENSVCPAVQKVTRRLNDQHNTKLKNKVIELSSDPDSLLCHCIMDGTGLRNLVNSAEENGVEATITTLVEEGDGEGSFIYQWIGNLFSFASLNYDVRRIGKLVESGHEIISLVTAADEGYSAMQVANNYFVWLGDEEKPFWENHSHTSEASMKFFDTATELAAAIREIPGYDDLCDRWWQKHGGKKTSVVNAAAQSRPRKRKAENIEVPLFDSVFAALNGDDDGGDVPPPPAVL